MVRCVTGALAVVSALALGSFGADDKDPVKEKLFAAKVTYDTEMQQFRKQVGEWFDKREDAARQDGDKKLVDLIKVERGMFDDAGTLPKTTPPALSQKQVAAKKALEMAYGLAVKEYVKAKKDDEAAAVEKELKAFRNSEDDKRREILMGTWAVTVGDYKGEWTFNENGVVDSSTSGAASGKWVLEAAKRRVLVTWKGGLQDKFDLPLDAKGTAGSQVGRMNAKLEAVKVK